MANSRHPNLLGFADLMTDPGTLARTPSPRPGPAGFASHRSLHVNALLMHDAFALRRGSAVPLPSTAADHGDLDIQQQYRELAIDFARSQLHVRETGDNRGTEVEFYTSSTGGEAGYAWCSSFAYWCHEQAAEHFGGLTTMPATFRAVFVWYDSKDVNLRYQPAEVRSGAVSPEPGDVFVMTRQSSTVNKVVTDTGDRTSGHAGLITGYDAARRRLLTIEGNTDEGGSTEGDGVYERTRRLSDDRMVGCVRPIMFM